MVHLCSHTVGISIAGLDDGGQTFFRSSGIPHTYIPSYSLAENPQIATLRLIAGSPHFVSDVERHFYEYTYDRPETYRHILWMAGPILDRLHQQENRFSIHSSAFAMQDQGVLIIGETNSGKTSTLLTAVLNRGHAAISGERTLITEDAIVGGTRHISLFSGLARELPSLRPFLEGREVGWSREHRLHLRLADIGPVRVAAALRLVVFATLNRNSPLEQIAWTPQKTSIELYKKMTEGIRAVGVLLFDNTVGFPSLDSAELSRSRMAAAKAIIAKARVLVLRGNAGALMDRIEDEAFRS